MTNLHIKLLAREGEQKDTEVCNEDGHLITAGLTNGPAADHPVNVFVRLDTSPKEAALALHKAADWVEELMAPENIGQMTNEADAA
jgi:hypothetical protein